jgi:2-polyprenyl-3-methyl-5-hydroxy-6-metoxy-1,4-benzoquinol methylase
MINYKDFYEHYHRKRLLPKRLITKKNFTYRHIISFLDRYLQGKKVLDFGSGVGSISLYLANQGKKVTGIEVSPKAVKMAKQSAQLFGLTNKISFLTADIFKTNLKQKFDFIICSEVLEHLHDDGKALKRLRSLLKPSGRVLISVPSAQAPLIKFGVIKHFDDWSGHLRRYTMPGLVQLLKSHGFKVIATKKSEGLFRNALFVFPRVGGQIVRVANRFAWVSDLLTFFDDFFLNHFGESQLIIVAKPSRKL